MTYILLAMDLLNQFQTYKLLLHFAIQLSIKVVAELDQVWRFYSKRIWKSVFSMMVLTLEQRSCLSGHVLLFLC